MYSGNSKITFILAAAGVGKRMNLGYPKQFLTWKDKPIFIYPLEVAEKSSLVEDIIVVTGPESVEMVQEYCKEHGITKVKNVVPGGSERQYSIYNALAHCNQNNYIAIQDGVRPFMKEKYLIEAFNKLEDNKELSGVVIGVPVKDTIKIVDEDGIILETPRRDTLFGAHTPQVFRGDILKIAYQCAQDEKFLGTDDSSLVERLNKRIGIIVGDYDNIKITTQEDLKFLK
ncbi:MAG: 2-C-methyl-D-erythritol 4-phosphate cytidylyltransferase [Cetobacterium sp.]